MNTINKILGLGLCLFFSAGCKKYIGIPPPTTSISADNVYTNDATAAAVMTGLFINMAEYSYFPGGGYTSTGTELLGLCADELKRVTNLDNLSKTAYYSNGLYSNMINIGVPDYWGGTYTLIYSCNSTVEGASASSSLTPAVKQQLTGEAKFMRAYCYYYLVNLYGDVPLILSTDYTKNSLLPRTSKDSVWKQIISDLTDAQQLLSAKYLDASLQNVTSQRVRPTQAAASAMLARAYLYTGDWADAETAATAVISNGAYQLDSLNGVFLANSKESIWQLQPVMNNINTGEGRTFIIPATGFDNFISTEALSNAQLNSFEQGDLRRKNWVDSIVWNGATYYYAYKYKVTLASAPLTEYIMMLRLGEQYLIRAEARAQQGHLSDAAADLNAVRSRSGLPPTTASTLPDFLTAVLHERQTELFLEWGQRWFDLKRMNAVDSVMSIATPLKGGTWASYKQYFPIPVYDIQHDVNLVQNNGY